MQVDEKNARSWKEYGMEFLMLFAAVTLGFFAENQRESMVNKQSAKQIRNNSRALQGQKAHQNHSIENL